MNLYNAGALLKALVGVGILAILYNYVNVYQDPAIGISFGFLGVFMIVRGVCYFVFLWMHRLFSQQPKHLHTSLSYKLSLMISMYVMVNLTLIITNHRNKFIGIAILIFFVVLQTLFSKNKSKEITF